MTPPPAMIGTYPVDRVLGSGGFGTVYAGRHPASGQPVAIKVFDQMGLDQAVVREQVLREAASLRAVRSGNCLQVLDVVVDDGGTWGLVTDYVDGVSLRDLLDQRGPLSGPEALTVMWGAIQGLAAVHEAGLVHGDVKPANILVESNGNSRLIDFGLAALPGWIAPDELSPWGSPAYASPEQVVHGFRDARSDLYSLTITLYEVLCHRRPFTGDTIEQVRRAHVHEPLPDPRLLVPDLGDELTQLLLWGAAKDPDQRPPDVATFLEYFHRAAEARYGPSWWCAAALGSVAGGLLTGGVVSGVTLGGTGQAAVAVGAGAAGTAGATGASGAVSTGLLSTAGAKAAAAAAAAVLVVGGTGGAWVATDGFGSGNGGGSGQVHGVRGGDLTIADGPRQRDVYAYVVLDGGGISLVAMEGTDQVASVPLGRAVNEGFFDAPTVAWSDDGRYLAFHDDERLYAVDTETGAVQHHDCTGPEPEYGGSRCPGSVTIWGDQIVTTDGPHDYERGASDLVSYDLPDLGEPELLFDSEPADVQWGGVRAVGDVLLVTGTDSARRGEGYRGGDPGVLYTFTRDGAATLVEDNLSRTDLPAATLPTSADPATAVVVDSGSGGACSEIYRFLLLDPEDPSSERRVSDDDMFVREGQRGDIFDQESGHLGDVWFGADGTLYASAHSKVCSSNFDLSYSETSVGTPLSVWRLDGDTWVDAGEPDVWATRDLPSGARLTLDAHGSMADQEVPDPNASLTLHGASGDTQIADDVRSISAPPIGDTADTVAAAADGGDYDSDIYTTKCGSPPTFTPVTTEATDVGITVTYEVHAVCPGGQWLNWSQLRVPLTVGGEVWLDGYFDYSLTPYWIPEEGTVHRLTYPYSGMTVPYEQVADEVATSPEVIVVPCEEGPDNSDDGSVPSAPTDPGDVDIRSTGDTATDDAERQETALEALRRIAAEDESAVEALDWTAQLSSKKPGTRDDGIVYDTYDKILALHLRHRARYPSSLLVLSTDWPGSYGPSSRGYWITLSGDSYSRTRPVIRWCRAEGWSDGDCWAKRLRRTGDPDDNTDHAPADRSKN